MTKERTASVTKEKQPVKNIADNHQDIYRLITPKLYTIVTRVAQGKRQVFQETTVA